MSASPTVTKTLLSTTAFTALLLSPAFAADLRGVAPVPAFTWAGFYVGAHAGAIFTNTSFASAGPFGWRGPDGGNKPGGFVGGVQAGYNWQFSNLVVGVEADISGTSASGSTAIIPVVPVANYRSSMSWMGTLRGRGGFAFDRTLIYVTGGLAYGEAKQSLNDLAFPFTASTNSRLGLTGGIGVEYAINNNWSARIEYLYVKFANRTSGLQAGAYTFAFKDTASIARVGLNYRF